MKVDFYISSLSGGGAEKVLTTLAESFADRGNDVGIMSLEKRPQFYSVSDSVELSKVNNTGKTKLAEMISDFFAIRKRLKQRNADVNISFLSRCNILVLYASMFTSKKVIVCDRNNPLMEHSMRVFKRSCRLYRFASAVFVQTEKIKSFYPEYLQDKIYVLENPIDFDELHNQIDNKKIDREDAIISIGRLEKQKDFTTLIKAFSLVANDYPSWKLRIFGKGDMKDELVALANGMGLGDRVQFCGRTEEPFYELKKSKIFVLSSNYEGFPNALCEAMAAGVACISSDCVSGPNELINQGENGYLFPVGDYESLAQYLRECIESDTLRNELGNNASESVSRLDVSKIVDKWQNTILKL